MKEEELNLITKLKQSTFCRRHYYKKGDALINQGCCDGHLYLLEDANISVAYHSISGKRYTISYETNFTGILGEMEIFRDEEESVFSIFAEHKSQCYIIDRKHITECITQDPQIAISLLKIISSRYENSITQAMKRILYPLKYNIIDTLLQKSQHCHDGWFDLHVTKNSTLLGSSSRSYRRILKALLDQNLIQKQGKKYQIIDKNSLENELKNCDI
ncbi:Crp/Fnr family transcriptional regulator [Photobacterium leiognathi]|uniref:Crp/Fnr family transcriptional regulator n=2 Tax=Photobacterium leiognathi TaxID=553611 RepID=UPI002980FDDC|nr:Crp/Fnr family transcriptional regulator [Photobacterium leiognathi]